jgi:predicted PurR-regulated permease PerM
MASQFMTNGISSFFKMSSSYVQQNMQAMQQLTSQSVMSNAEELASNEDEQSKNMMQQMINLASASNPISAIASTVLSFFDYLFGEDEPVRRK